MTLYSNNRTTYSSEEAESSPKQLLPDNDIEENKKLKPDEHLLESSKPEEQKRRRKRTIFFRIWFGLRKKELTKIALGSFAAAFSGISKPVFGFYIITIGIAYYQKNARRQVGLYSWIFSVIGLLSLFSHTLQHYFFGIVGEKAMTNLRRALFSGILNSITTLCFPFS